MSRKLVAERFDMQSGITRRLWYDAADDSFTWEREQDVEPILDLNHEIATSTAPGKDLRHVAAIPPLIWGQWATAHLRGEGPAPASDDWWPWLRRKLNDSDYRRFRVHGGTV